MVLSVVEYNVIAIVNRIVVEVVVLLVLLEVIVVVMVVVVVGGVEDTCKVLYPKRAKHPSR